MSDATKMGDELLSLARGVIPQTSEWKTEIFLERGKLPASRNKFLACNAAELLFAWLRRDLARVREILDWWVWFATTPLSEGEDLTPEEVYRSLMAYSHFVAHAVARLTGHAAAIAAAGGLARAHVTWLILGIGAGPGRVVTDHHLEDINAPCVLAGDGKPTELAYVAQAGPRGLIRSREKNTAPTFHFAESVGLSVMVKQAASGLVRRGLAPWQVDLFVATCALSPGIAPFGFSEEDRAAVRAFMADPTSAVLARHLLTWIERFCPSLDFTFIRYIDGTIIVWCHRTGGSSTDPRVIDSWWPDGKTRKTSADDGLRASSLPEIGWETTTAICCQLVAGGRVMSIAKPIGVEEAYRVNVRSQRATLSIDGPPAGLPAGPDVAPPDPSPAKPGKPGKKGRRRRHRPGKAA